MTDRQITESSIGLAGRLSHLSYGVTKAEDRGWKSTRNFAQSTPVLKELGPYETWLLPTGITSVPTPGTSVHSSFQTNRNQQKWLLKAHPEARLGNECFHDQLRSSHSPMLLQEGEAQNSSLFSIGELTDTSETQKVSGAPLLAIATGEANDVLCLTKPSSEEWRWHDDDSVSIQVSGVADDYESVFFQEEVAVPIRRLKCVVDFKRYDPTRWVVVQRDSGTRIFKPEYRRVPTLSECNSAGRPTRIVANPLLSIPIDRTGGNPHSDASFNPGVRSRPPQLGIIDECGYWSVWDIAYLKTRSSGKPKAKLDKCGQIERGVLRHLPARGTGGPQWHKLLWVDCPRSSLEESQTAEFEEDADTLESQGPFPQLVRSSTLLLCNSKVVKLLDLTKDSFLPNLPFIGEGGRDCILDVHGNPQNSQYVFVLTALKLFVVRIHSAPVEDWGEPQKQWNIVLVISHLRNSLDHALKLSVAPGPGSPTQATSLVHVHSNSNKQIDLFFVAMSKTNPSMVTYHREGVATEAFQHTSVDSGVQTMCLHPTPVALRPSNPPSQSARSLAKQEVRFYQLATLTTDMCLFSTLCVSTSIFPIHRISRPSCKASRTKDYSKERRRLLKHMSARFVIPDDITGHDDGLLQATTRRPRAFPQWPTIQRDIGIFYEHLCAITGGRIEEPMGLRDEGRPGINPFDNVHVNVQQAIENGIMPATTLFEMIGKERLPNDTDLSTEWRIQIERLRHVDPNVRLLGFDQPQRQITRCSNSLQDMYSMLLEMTSGSSINGEAQDWIQEARYTVFRQMACDTYLSLFGLVHRPVDIDESQQLLLHDLDNMAIDSQQASRAGSVAMSQSGESITSSKRSKSEEPQGEDPAMTLLRSYTGTGNFVPAKNTALLDKWKVGANPEDYVFDLDRNREVTPAMQKRAKQLARESRKRRRAETLFKGTQEPTLPATQPVPDIHSYNQHSQPLKQYSQSQAIMSDAIQTMSQPVTGAFGRREERPKKKQKRRKGGF
ncbi:uncharacterized protein F4822DRAFT_253923 [Hypoxylon trugodes]|uniref:uncharacterized protein n=1 Tax=Hypoxylon trugodes TaxID=326681 RepID=UPI002194294E|nr:uncharacterized protein F4822DRAFT_253923 [Hypoxylon trugodes]KAI1388716.1 hypothetical protein F4822DRAFT_253923 [Hypoxylon trugodes]